MRIGEYRERLRIELSDTGVATWEDHTLDQAVREALEDYNDANPEEAIGTLTFASASRELDVSSLARLIDVLRVWCPYTAADPEFPPEWRTGFELWPGSILYIADGTEPDADDVARIWYTRTHTIQELDAATSTSIPVQDTQLLVVGASAYAGSARARELSETVTAEDEAYRQIAGFAFRRMNEFRAGLNRIRAKAAGGYVSLPVQRRRRVPRQ